MRARRSSSSTLAVVGLAFLALLSTGAHTVRSGETLARDRGREPHHGGGPRLARTTSPTPISSSSASGWRSRRRRGAHRVLVVQGALGRHPRARSRSRHGTSVAALVQLNGSTNPNLIRIGQVLQGPGGRWQRAEREGSRRRRDHPRRARRGDAQRRSPPAMASRWPRSWRPTGSPAIASTSASSFAWCRRPARSPTTATHLRRPLRRHAVDHRPEVRHHGARAPGRQRHPRRRPRQDRPHPQDPRGRHRRWRGDPMPGAGRRHGS